MSAPCQSNIYIYIYTEPYLLFVKKLSKNKMNFFPLFSLFMSFNRKKEKNGK